MCTVRNAKRFQRSIRWNRRRWRHSTGPCAFRISAHVPFVPRQVFFLPRKNARCLRFVLPHNTPKATVRQATPQRHSLRAGRRVLRQLSRRIQSQTGQSEIGIRSCPLLYLFVHFVSYIEDTTTSLYVEMLSLRIRVQESLCQGVTLT